MCGRWSRAAGVLISPGARSEEVVAPTLFIVGGADPHVLELNRESLSQIAAEERKLEIIAGATHLFEEPGALEQVAALAGYWFSSHLVFRREPEWSYG